MERAQFHCRLHYRRARVILSLRLGTMGASMSGGPYIYIIHGIRTRATWMPALQEDISSSFNDQVGSGAYYYGGFSLPMFLLRARLAEGLDDSYLARHFDLSRGYYNKSAIPLGLLY